MARVILAVVVVAISFVSAFGQTKLILPGAEVNIDDLTSYRHASGYQTLRTTSCTTSSLRTASVSGPVDCRALCNKDPRCAAVTYNAFKQRCYLKPSCEQDERELNAENTSFQKKGYTALTDAESKAYALWSRAEEIKAAEAAIVPDYLDKNGKYRYFGGYDVVENFGCLRSSIDAIDAKTFNDCKAACNVDIRCGAITYNENTGRCFLKPSCVSRERQSKKNNTSGIKKKFEEPTLLEAADFLAERAREERLANRPAGTYKFNEGKRCRSLGQAMLSMNTATSGQECRARCDGVLECRHYSFRAKKNMCRLFRSTCAMVNHGEWFTASRTN